MARQVVRLMPRSLVGESKGAFSYCINRSKSGAQDCCAPLSRNWPMNTALGILSSQADPFGDRGGGRKLGGLQPRLNKDVGTYPPSLPSLGGFVARRSLCR